MLRNLCKNCNICEFMPEQKVNRVLCMEIEGSTPPILVIDSQSDMTRYAGCIDIAHDLLGMRVDFTYTTAIRCHYRKSFLSTEEEAVAASRCSVWTNLLLPGRKLILSTVEGISQMKLETTKEIEPGDLFRSERLGTILCIPPLDSRSHHQSGIQTKINFTHRSALFTLVL